MSVERISLKRLRRQFETLLALRHSLEQQRLEIEALAVISGNVALAELAEQQAETLTRLKREWSAIWRELDEALTPTPSPRGRVEEEVGRGD